MPTEALSIAVGSFALEEMRLGERTTWWMEVDAGASDLTRIPAIAVRGSRPGKTLVVVAGIHGNEYEGMEATRRVLRILDPGSMAGNVLALVVANPWAYAARLRTTPVSIDGLNLARAFPGDSQGTPTERLADALFDLVTRHLTADGLLLDFHSGTAQVAFLPMCGFRLISGGARHVSEEAARHIGLPRLWAIPDGAGPLNAEVARIGLPAVGTETTGRAGCREKDVAEYEAGLWNLLAYLGIVTGRVAPTRDARPARTTINLTVPATAFARMDVRLGQQVRPDQRIATMTDAFGTAIEEVRSPVAGEVWAALESPVVEAGDLLCMIAVDAP